MPIRSSVLAFFVFAVAVTSVAAPRESTRGDLIVIDASQVVSLERSGLPVLWKGAGFHVALWDADQVAAARRASVPFDVVARDYVPGGRLFIFETRDESEVPVAWRDNALWSRGRKWLVEMDTDKAEDWIADGYSAIRVPLEPRGWERRAPLVAYDCAFDPLVDGLIGATDQARWVDWIEKLSGAEPVSVGGEDYTIETRYSSPMFSGAATAKAYDFALQQLQSWHYDGARLEEHAYNPGGGQTWQNLILTLPGETSPDEIVLLTGHLDSINQSNVMDAPGANDNGTGNAAMFEAARLLRRYRFERTIKIVFFTGEEDGLLGSGAFVDDYPIDGYLGVVNLDMFGWDGDDDRCFELHVGTLAASQDVGNCFASSLTNYGLGLSRDYLTFGATDRSDHASFWQVNVGAIEIAENFFNDGLPDGCVGQDANPGYHTTNDTVAANLVPSFGVDIARAGLATIAAMAVPIEACLDGAPFLWAVPQTGAVDLNWSPVAGASSYRIYRSTVGCQGQWFEVGETVETSWIDTGADQALTYSYRVEAVHADGFCVSAESNCASATPTIYHASSIEAAPLDTCASGGVGDGDGVVDPGESVLFPVTLYNDGNMSLSGIAGTLSTTTAGITVVDAEADWPDLGPGEQAVSLPDHFGWQVADDVPCGTSVETSIALAYAEGTNDTGLSLPVGKSFETVLLAEDFGAGIPSGWTIVDGGSGGGNASTWTAANPGGREIDVPFDSPFAIVDSDEAGSGASQDEQLISPPFDATGCRGLTLDFSSQFNWYSGSGDEVGDVDVSTNGGASWNNKLRIQGGHDGYPAPITKSVNIMPTGAPWLFNVQVRFHYHQAQYEWWWAVDNVQVRCERRRCTPCEAIVGAPGEPGVSAPLTVRRESGNLVFEWGAPESECGTLDHALYKGDLTTLHSTGYSHDTPLSCATGSTTWSIPETDASIGPADYYLVVSDNGTHEGSYGRDSEGAERPAAVSACHVDQDLSSCSP